MTKKVSGSWGGGGGTHSKVTTSGSGAPLDSTTKFVIYLKGNYVSVHVAGERM